MIKNFYGDNILYTSKIDSYGGVDLNIGMIPQYKEALEWLVQFKQEHEQEKLYRQNHPAVKNAYEQYQVVLQLSRSDTDNAKSSS